MQKLRIQSEIPGLKLEITESINVGLELVQKRFFHKLDLVLDQIHSLITTLQSIELDNGQA